MQSAMKKKMIPPTAIACVPFLQLPLDGVCLCLLGLTGFKWGRPICDHPVGRSPLVSARGAAEQSLRQQRKVGGWRSRTNDVSFERPPGVFAGSA
jgi:hypothetical protein